MRLSSSSNPALSAGALRIRSCNSSVIVSDFILTTNSSHYYMPVPYFADLKRRECVEAIGTPNPRKTNLSLCNRNDVSVR